MDQGFCAAVRVRIARYANDPGFYLLYFDANGDEMTDTYHDSIEDAMAQADFEFEVRPDEWESVTP